MLVGRKSAAGAVVTPGAELRSLASGFLFTEGALWHPTLKFLYFSDMPGDVMRRWDPVNGVQEVRRPSRMANGLTFDRAGRLLTCEHASSSVTRTEPDGRVVTLASRWQGRELNSPNDIIVGSDGAIYFSDPTFGRMDFYGVPREAELAHRGVYRIAPDGTLALLADDFAQPNGLCLSLDERRLFVNDTERGHVRVFELRESGSLGGGEVFAEPQGEEPGAPDGMKLDSEGRLFTCGPGGLHVFSPEAEPLGVIRVPEVCANFTWGGEGFRTLLITASTSLYAVEVDVPGRPTF